MCPPIAGFSTIIFYAYGREIRVHGFLQREVREMKALVEGRRLNYRSLL